jgi:hypothetical protein
MVGESQARRAAGSPVRGGRASFAAMSSSSPARTARRVPAGLLHGLAWLALLGMLLGPLAPRRAEAPERQVVDAEIVDAAEIEGSSDASAQRLVQRGSRFRVGPPGARRWVHPRVDDLRPALARTRWTRRVGVPRRVVPTDDDPDDQLG